MLTPKKLIMKKSKLLLTLIALFTLIAFSSCSEFEEDAEFIEIENAETQAAERIVGRGGINDYVGGWNWKVEASLQTLEYQEGNDTTLRKRPGRSTFSK